MSAFGQTGMSPGQMIVSGRVVELQIGFTIAVHETRR
jgi:hypothetical protein